MGRTKAASWKTGGKEDQIIEEMIKNGLVTKSTKPAELKLMNPAFMRFTDSVIRNHLAELKRFHGLYLIDDTPRDTSNDGDVADQPENEKEVEPTSSICKKTDQDIVIKQYPYVCGTFKNVEDEVDMVLVGVSVPGGANNVTFDVATNGLSVLVKFEWPNTMYDAIDMFKNEISEGMQMYHPMIISFKHELQNVRDKIDAAPMTEIVIPLPFKVETSPTSWTKTGLTRNDGTLVIKAVFKGFVQSYNKKTVDNKIIFKN